MSVVRVYTLAGDFISWMSRAHFQSSQIERLLPICPSNDSVVSEPTVEVNSQQQHQTTQLASIDNVPVSERMRTITITPTTKNWYNLFNSRVKHQPTGTNLEDLPTTLWRPRNKIQRIMFYHHRRSLQTRMLIDRAMQPHQDQQQVRLID